MCCLMVVLSWSHTAFSLKEVEGGGRRRKEEEGRGRGGEGVSSCSKEGCRRPPNATGLSRASRAHTTRAVHTLICSLLSHLVVAVPVLPYKVLELGARDLADLGERRRQRNRGTGEQGVRGGSSGGRVDEAAQRRDGREAAGRHVIGAGERSVRSVDGLSQQK
jgi:hypothetical protein